MLQVVIGSQYTASFISFACCHHEVGRKQKSKKGTLPLAR